MKVFNLNHSHNFSSKYIIPLENNGAILPNKYLWRECAPAMVLNMAKIQLLKSVAA